MARIKVLITGSNGYIGQALHAAFKDEFDIALQTRNTFNLLDTDACNTWFTDKYFDVVIHTAIKGGNRLVKETSDILDQNLLMYYNLLNNREKYSKFINFGSGAEIYARHTPYGLSKHVIAESIKEKKNFFNIRLFGLFNINEDERRFIKSNIVRYKNKENLIVHQDKKMDFFFMEDFISVVKYFILNNSLPKVFDCTYEKSYFLSEIANMINTLSEHRVKINIETKSKDQDYIGTFTNLIPYKGLEFGIKKMYKSFDI